MSGPIDTEFHFGSDLLISEADRARAQRNYPALFFALDNPELRALYDPIDREANRAKTRSRLWGVIAVIMITAALMVGATITHSSGEESIVDKAIAAGAAIGGALGVAIGSLGVMFGAAKERWLERRYLTERMRQFHFQSMSALAPAIVRAAQSGDHIAFLAKRAKLTNDFANENVRGVAGKLAATIAETTHEESWLVEMEEPAPAPSEELDDLFDALTHLRIRHQIKFADFKLRADAHFFSSSPRRQASVFSGVALACVFGLLAMHFLVVYGVVGQVAALSGPEVHVAVIWLALLALAARTLEEGFQSQQEVERYRQYGAALRLAEQRFKASDDPREKLAALRELENVAYEEMVNFLKANHEARFVM